MCDALALHDAYKRGDLAALRRLLGEPPDFPNCRGPQGVGEIILAYAIYQSPLAFIRALLELGADPNYQDHAGFPALIAALSSARADRYEIIELLLASGADIQQRGLNDWTPLHYAAATDDVEAIELLLATAPTRTRAPGSTTAPHADDRGLQRLAGPPALRTLDLARPDAAATRRSPPRSWRSCVRTHARSGQGRWRRALPTVSRRVYSRFRDRPFDVRRLRRRGSRRE